MNNITKQIASIVVLFAIIAAFEGCVKPRTSFTDKTDSTKKTQQNTNRKDSTDIYGSGYFEYRDTIESFHMGYSIPRDSIYKVDNLKAFEQLNLLIKKDTLNPGPYLDRGNHFQNIQKDADAIRDYDMYIRLNPYNYSAYQNRGTAHERLKQFDLAIWDYNKVIELKPDDTIAFFNKGVVYDALENPWQSLREYDEVVKRDPRLAKVYYNRGAAYEKIAYYEKALEDYKKAIELNPQYKAELEKKMDYLNLSK